VFKIKEEIASSDYCTLYGQFFYLDGGERALERITTSEFSHSP